MGRKTFNALADVSEIPGLFRPPFCFQLVDVPVNLVIVPADTAVEGFVPMNELDGTNRLLSPKPQSGNHTSITASITVSTVWTNVAFMLPRGIEPRLPQRHCKINPSIGHGGSI